MVTCGFIFRRANIKRDQLLRVRSSLVQFDAIRQDKKMLTCSRSCIAGTRSVVGTGEEGPLFDPGSELLLGCGREV